MTTIRPPTRQRARAPRAAPRSRAASSPLTSIRSAWKVRLAGLPPVRRAAAGMAERTRSTSRAGASGTARWPARGRRGRRSAGRTAPRRTPAGPAASSVGRVGVEHVGRREPGGLVHAHVQRRVLGVGEAAVGARPAAGWRPRGRTGRPAPGARPSSASTSGSSSYTACTRVTRSANGASRSRDRPSACGSRSSPTSRSCGNRRRIASLCPPRPSGGVDEDGVGQVQRGGQQREAALEEHRHVPWHGGLGGHGRATGRGP